LKSNPVSGGYPLASIVCFFLLVIIFFDIVQITLNALDDTLKQIVQSLFLGGKVTWLYNYSYLQTGGYFE